MMFLSASFEQEKQTNKLFNYVFLFSNAFLIFLKFFKIGNIDQSKEQQLIRSNLNVAFFN